jgi:hypothetical protein
VGRELDFEDGIGVRISLAGEDGAAAGVARPTIAATAALR